MNIDTGSVSSEPCDECGAVDWRELTEEEFASVMDTSGYLMLQSDYLRSELEAAYAGGDEAGEWIRVLKKLVDGLEGISDEETAKWLESNKQKRPRIIEYLLDDFYTRDFLKKARKMVDRTMQLAVMVPRATPDPGVNIYLREATRSYIAGLWKSSVALSRTTLEFALKQRMQEEGFPPNGDLNEIIKAAYRCRVLDHGLSEMAHDVRLKGNDVVHGSAADKELAWHLLTSTRGVLSYLYSGRR
jgi:hypothetical protein